MANTSKIKRFRPRHKTAIVLSLCMSLVISMLLSVPCANLNAATGTGKVQYTSAAECIKNGITNADLVRRIYEDQSNTLRYTTVPETESNNTFATADLLTVDPEPGSETHMYGYLSATDTVDYYTIHEQS